MWFTQVPYAKPGSRRDEIARRDVPGRGDDCYPACFENLNLRLNGRSKSAAISDLHHAPCPNFHPSANTFRYLRVSIWFTLSTSKSNALVGRFGSAKRGTWAPLEDGREYRVRGQCWTRSYQSPRSPAFSTQYSGHPSTTPRFPAL